MKELTDLEITKAAILKTWRAGIRLKHTIAADREISENLPMIERQLDYALLSGEPFELNPGEIFNATTSGD